MDFVIELLVQVIVQVVIQFVVEVLLASAYHGARRLLQSRWGRWAMSAIISLGFGLVWGAHLAGRPDPPNLLWVSLGLAVATIMLIRRNAARGRLVVVTAPGGFLRQAFTPPWNWPWSRLVDFAGLNLTMAAGIVIGYSAF